MPQAETVPDEVRREYEAYVTSLQGLRDPMQRFADAAAKHAEEDETHHRITTGAERWSKGAAGSPEGMRFERFLGCAIPALEQIPDRKGLTRWYLDQCVTGDASAYMKRVRTECAPALMEAADGGMPPPPNATLQKAAQRFRQVDIKGVPLMKMVLGICTANVRKQWLNSEGQPLLTAASAVFDAERAVRRAINRFEVNDATARAGN
jgi:hypothetical protein